MKNLLLKLLFSKAGPVISGAVATGIGVLAAKTAEYGVIITPEQTTEVAAWTAATLVTVAQGLLLNSAANGVKKIQQATGAPVDGVPGPVTVSAVQDAVVSPARKLPLGGAGK